MCFHKRVLLFGKVSECDRTYVCEEGAFETESSDGIPIIAIKENIQILRHVLRAHRRPVAFFRNVPKEP